MRVLIVDDEPEFITLARLLLGGDPTVRIVGYASSGCHALDIVAELRPHVAVVDAYMPGLSGFAVTRLLVERCPDLRVVVVSSNDDPLYIALAKAAGAVGFLDKRHFSAEALAATLATSN